MRWYGESGVIGIILEKWHIIPDYGNLGSVLGDELKFCCGSVTHG